MGEDSVIGNIIYFEEWPIFGNNMLLIMLHITHARNSPKLFLTRLVKERSELDVWNASWESGGSPCLF